MIITGAPVEKMAFEEVDYWDEMCRIMEWSKENVYSVLHICWGAQAGLYYHYGIPKYPLPEKLSGIYNHTVLNPYHPLDAWALTTTTSPPTPAIPRCGLEDIKRRPELIPLAVSDLAGAAHRHQPGAGGRSSSPATRSTTGTRLAKEYFRDINKGLNPKVPYHYFPDDDDTKTPPFTWRCNAHLAGGQLAQLLCVPADPLRLFKLNHRPLPAAFFVWFFKTPPSFLKTFPAFAIIEGRN